MVTVAVPEVATIIAFRTHADGRSDLVVIGPRTKGSYHQTKNPPICVRLKLPPGQTRPALGVSADRLADRAIALTDLWGTKAVRLTQKLTQNPGEAKAEIRAALGEPPQRPILQAAAKALTRPEARLAEIAADLGVSERSLRTLFAGEIGLSPKQFARISRLRKVLARAGKTGWAALADDTGFFDQAHLIGDFRTLMGVTPAAYVAGRLPAPTECLMAAQADR